MITPEGACIRRAVSQNDLLAAYLFSRKTRTSLGYPPPAPDEIWPGRDDDAQGRATFFAKAWPGVVASTGLVLDGADWTLPADRVFPEVRDIRGDGRVLAEVVNRLTQPAYYKTVVPGELLRCSVAHGIFVGCTDILAVLRPWEASSCEALGFVQMGAVRSSGGAVPEPVVLTRLDLAAVRRACPAAAKLSGAAAPSLWRFYFAENPYARLVKGWAALVEEQMRGGKIFSIGEIPFADKKDKSFPDADDLGVTKLEDSANVSMEASTVVTAVTQSESCRADQQARGKAARADRIIRRVAHFRRAGLFSQNPVGFTVSRAMTLDEYWQAYRLVHDCYIERGYIEPYPGGVRIRSFEAMPEMATFVAKVDGRVVAVTSVLMDSPELGLPSDRVFGDELRELRDASRRVVEITNLAVHPDYRKTNVFSELTRCCLTHAMAIKYDDLFIAISPEHARFFKEVLLFESHGDKRDYSDTVKDIVVGMRLNLRTLQGRTIETDVVLREEAFLHDFYFARNPYHEYVRRWAIRAAGTFCDADLLRELFIIRSGLFGRLSHREMAAVRQRWGEETWRDVFDFKAAGRGAAGADEIAPPEIAIEDTPESSASQVNAADPSSS